MRIRAQETFKFLEDVIIYTQSLLPCGYTLDNPIYFPETGILHQCIRNELARLEAARPNFLLEELMMHLQAVGEKAFKPAVLGSAQERLGNPMFPAGYVMYREWFCAWAARACFMAPISRTEICKIAQNMRTKKGVWWVGLPLLEV